MKIKEATELISGFSPVTNHPQHWADLGCGTGIFSKALAFLLPEASLVYCCDREQRMESGMISDVQLRFIKIDFEKELLQVRLDGILMANSLHYIQDQPALLTKWKNLLNPGRKFIVIEYDTEAGNPWVPFPVSVNRLKQIFTFSGIDFIRLLGTRKSVYGEVQIYACEATI